MKSKRRYTVALRMLVMVAVMVAAMPARGQMSTNSPFTRYGYGQMVDGTFGRSQAMGDVAIGIYSPTQINPVNPATYTSTDSTTFLFEIGISGLVSNFRSNGASTNKFTGTLDYVAFQTPITKWLGASAGLIPYSYVGYNYEVSDSIALAGTENQNLYTQNFQGNGGVSQVYLGLSFNILDYVTFGANGYYMFGNLNHYRTMEYTSSDLSGYPTVCKTQEHISNFNVRFGLQYHQKFGKDHKLNLGAIYEFKTKLSGDYTMTLMGVDTLTESVKSKDYFEMPQMWGVGFSYTYANRLTVGADFTMHEFSKAKFAGVTDTLANRMKISVGAEYINNPMGRRYVDRMYWRLGANYRNSYVRIGDQSTRDFSITMGIGFPLRTSKTIIHFNMEYGNIGSGQFTALKENYFKFGFSFALNETWFMKNKIR